MMGKFGFGAKYFLTTYKEMNEYLNFMINDDRDKQIKYIFTNGSSKNGHMVDSDIFIVFDNDTVLKINYLFYSLMYVRYMWVQNLYPREKECNNDKFKVNLDISNLRIDGYEIERFTEEYEIDPSTSTTRPNGGDYFKQITLKLSNGKKLCICAEDSEVDGYCNIWIE